MDLELSPAVTPQYMILQPEKKRFNEFIDKPDETVHASPGCPENSDSYLHGKVFATGDKGRPVAIFKESMWRCPPKIVTCSRLYLSITVLVSLVHYSAPAADGS